MNYFNFKIFFSSDLYANYFIFLFKINIFCFHLSFTMHVVIRIAFIFVAASVAIAAPWANHSQHCYQQDLGELHLDYDGMCESNSICVHVKNCRNQNLLFHFQDMQMNIDEDEIRGCFSRPNVCIVANLAGCDCKECFPWADEIQHMVKKMAILVLINMVALALAIFGPIGHLLMLPNLLMIAGGIG